MSSAETSTEYEKYYVPESSSLAVRATIGLVLSVFGGGLVLNEMTFGGTHDTGGAAKWVLFAGARDVHSDANVLVQNNH
jgi:cytochrome c oxidase subunit 3